MTYTSKKILESEVLPYCAKKDGEFLAKFDVECKTYFVFIPYNRLRHRARIGERTTEIIYVDKSDARAVREMRARTLINRLYGGKLYLLSGGSVRELTDETIIGEAKHKIKNVLWLTSNDDSLSAFSEKKVRGEELDSIRANQRAYNTYVRDSRPIERHKFNKAVRVTCDGKSYGSLGNYIGVKKSGTAKVVCKINF